MFGLGERMHGVDALWAHTHVIPSFAVYPGG